ncbi:MAG: hypothetical protein CVV33_05785 [Methanomicrobiales archaeon HGW-Methanomicrobiales-4]|nr:MAG: hypothetical protein CVV33_05785 [Methanomicrobiales archaeon HGW-Methanomicrobiales-4]
MDIHVGKLGTIEGKFAIIILTGTCRSPVFVSDIRSGIAKNLFLMLILQIPPYRAMGDSIRCPSLLS